LDAALEYGLRAVAAGRAAADDQALAAGLDGLKLVYLSLGDTGGLTAAIAVKGTWGWPFLVTLLITGYGYLFGLGSYGIAEEGTPDDADIGRQARRPSVSS